MRRMLAAAVLAACGGDSTTPAPPAWDKTLPDARMLGERRGLVPARGIVHLHSPYSHDACDGKPRDPVTNAPNEPCLADLRAALCTTRIDFAALTDHDASMAEEDFATLFSPRGGDVAVRGANGKQIASRMTCDDGHQVLFSVGGENTLMPVMLDEHVPGTVVERRAIYNGDDAIDAAAFRAAGGLVWVAHTESKPIEMLRDVAPDGIEVYNLHANIDPDIREMYLGLPAAGAISAAAEFGDTNEGHPEPDLAMLAFLAPNPPALATWNTLLAEGRRVAGSAGSDAHQNAIPISFADGERGDSYRRVLRWFANFALVGDAKDPVQIEQALARGRMFTAVELLGTPLGFDVRAATSTMVYELGDVAPPGAELVVELPQVLVRDPSLPDPVIRARVIHVPPGGAAVEVATGDAPTLSVPMTAAGAYRVEISIVPRHLGPYLGDLGPSLADAELPWIYASPIYVEP